MRNILFNWIWIRRIIDRHFDKLLLVILIGVSMAIAVVGDIAVISGYKGFNLVSRTWLREQTALLVGALLGLMRGGREEDSDVEPREPLPTNSKEIVRTSEKSDVS